MAACIYFLSSFYVAHSLVLFWFQLLFCFWEGGMGCVIFHLQSEGRELEDSAL